MENKKCLVCKKLFESYSSQKRKYCSRKCFEVSESGDKLEWKPCIICGNRKKQRLQKYCSSKCYGIGARGKIAWSHGKKLTDSHRYKLSLSHMGHKISEDTKEKMRKSAKSGSDSRFWKGGITPMNKTERTKFRLHLQSQVLRRDNFTCQLCGKRGGNLQVDHIQSWSEYVELRFNLDNCRTLCMDCHYQVTFGKPKPKNVIWGHNLKHVIERSVN